MLPPRDGVREVAPALIPYLESLKSAIPVRAVFVIGSRARNDHRRGSDIDLIVVSDAFSGLTRAERIELLLSPWNGAYVLEPFGFTAEELLSCDTVFLWEALADGRPVEDDGTFRRARELLERKIEARELQRTPHGWREPQVHERAIHGTGIPPSSPVP